MNCNKTEVFLSEWYRMCCSFDGKEGKCPVTLGCGVVQCANCRQLAMTGGDIIDIVQEWSDQHPVRTRLSVFKEQYPNCAKWSDGRPKSCVGMLYVVSGCVYNADGMCRNCEVCAENDFEYIVRKPQDCDMWEDGD